MKRTRRYQCIPCHQVVEVGEFHNGQPDTHGCPKNPNGHQWVLVD